MLSLAWELMQEHPSGQTLLLLGVRVGGVVRAGTLHVHLQPIATHLRCFGYLQLASLTAYHSLPERGAPWPCRSRGGCHVQF